MKNFALFAVVIVIGLTSTGLAAEHSLSFGFQYFYALEDIRDDFSSGSDDSDDYYHRDGLGMAAGYRINPNNYLGFLMEVQAYTSGYYDAKRSISPRVLVILGQKIFVGAGVAVNYLAWEDSTEGLHDSGNWSDPYFFLRGGVEIPIILDSLRLGLHANYELNNWNDVNEFNSDTLTFGAYVRVII